MNIVALSFLGLGFTAGVLFTSVNYYDKHQITNHQVVEKSTDTLEVKSGDLLDGASDKKHGLFFFRD